MFDTLSVEGVYLALKVLDKPSLYQGGMFDTLHAKHVYLALKVLDKPFLRQGCSRKGDN